MLIQVSSTQLRITVRNPLTSIGICAILTTPEDVRGVFL